MRGCLDRVKPNLGIWSLDAMDEFNQRLEAFFQTPILAKVTGINATVRDVSIFKTPTRLFRCNYFELQLII